MAAYAREIRTQVRLATPVVIAQVGMMMMGLVDTWFIGHIPNADTKVALAATVLGNMLFFAAASFSMGVLNVLDPVLSQARGAGDTRGFALGLQRGALLAVVLSVLLALPLAFAPFWLGLAGQDTTVIPDAALYTRIVAVGLPAQLLFHAARQTMQSLSRLRPVVVAVFAANGVNVLLDWMWIHGGLGSPTFGVAGAAWATNIARASMLAFLLFLAWPTLAPLFGRPTAAALRWRAIARMLRVGVPIGLQNTLEYWAFAIVGVMMGWISVECVGGHNVAIMPAALTFMVPLGVGAAASVRVGYGVGAGDPAGVRRSAVVSLGLGMCFMAFASVLLFVFARPIAAIFTHDEAIVMVAASLIPLAAAFQLFDGMQVVALGILRGVGDTVVPMTINLIGYWVIGFPVAYLLAFEAGLGARGLWWGLVAGLASVGLLLAWRVRRRLAGELMRLEVDHAPESARAGGLTRGGSGPSAG